MEAALRYLLIIISRVVSYNRLQAPCEIPAGGSSLGNVKYLLQQTFLGLGSLTHFEFVVQSLFSCASWTEKGSITIEKMNCGDFTTLLTSQEKLTSSHNELNSMAYSTQTKLEYRHRLF